LASSSMSGLPVRCAEFQIRSQRFCPAIPLCTVLVEPALSESANGELGQIERSIE